MDSIQLLQQRGSCPRLTTPAPSADQVELLLEAATSAPDHGKLRPWRFVVMSGTELERLGDAFAAASLAQNPELTDAALERVGAKPQRAPMIIAVVAEVVADHKIPELEQLMATACAAEHIMQAAYAQGLGAMWRTGAMARNDHVKRALGFAAKDEIVGFIYLGTPANELKPREPLDFRQFVRKLP